MILYTFTSDGGDREDANVFYSPVLVVNADPGTAKATVDAIITAALSVFSPRMKNGRIVIDKDGAGDEWYHDAPEWTHRVLVALTVAGYGAAFPEMTYVVAT